MMVPLETESTCDRNRQRTHGLRSNPGPRVDNIGGLDGEGDDAICTKSSYVVAHGQ